ncbi:substrate import-associated zinc metallohydrolase lipoprotein [Flavobacterium sp. 90]|uniref:substrate import-associated zinc metallohydrolase lipoprotein n=1 Tax=unclassified Flavobacterium TaxID=196869 RepID=UPI000EB43A59|nr:MULTISPECIES: substrate import-associated zinc metallohydrolase lipoprotein [unclassified Flavobacterium]RKR05450.1 substrate import-associated zinc metallohydrolase lipoprotein [Flavobacterium sp. 81]TCK56765.1 substrate import-associated zinc metallohydrolase lipoprotein [Flavobacterium sp. 90]
MKLIKQYKNIVLAVSFLTLASCSQEDQPKESLLNFTPKVKTDLDKWIDQNYIDPYNISVQYEWNQNVVDNERFLFPPEVDKVQPALEIIKKIWIDSYTTIGGKDFVKIIAPRDFVLVGGVNVNPDDVSNTLGLAEGGKRISLFQVDYVNKKNRESVTEFVHTIQHEYVHILNQTKIFDVQAWAKITPKDYSSDPFSISDGEAQELGFISAYARSNYIEDFAETAAIILLSSKEEYAALLASIVNPAGVDAIKKKEALVVQYYRDAFNIDFYELRDEAQKNTTEVLND